MRQIEIGAQDKVVVAASGGADSTALLDALARLRERKGLPGAIIVAHLNHQLRGEESDEDERFVRELAGQLQLPVSVESIAVAERAAAEKQNLEATARRLRYGFLLKTANEQEADFIFTAHTQDDQAETVLMRLLRGSGAEGLRGIHRVIELNEKVKLVRPMLGVTRAEVIEHCEHCKLAFRADSSNLSMDFTRNRIRRELLPMLRTFNPRAEESLARASGLLTEDEEFLQRVAIELLAGSRDGSHLKAETLRTAHRAITRRALRLWLRAERGDLRRIEASHIAAIERLINGRSGRCVELPEGWMVSREFDHLRLSRAVERPQDSPEPVELEAGQRRNFGDFSFVLERRIGKERLKLETRGGAGSFIAVLRECGDLDGLRLRTRVAGEAYVPAGSRRAIKLKTLMIRNKIPVSQRDVHPVLATADGRIVWSPGLPVAREFAPDDRDGERALVVVQKPGKA